MKKMITILSIMIVTSTVFAADMECGVVAFSSISTDKLPEPVILKEKPQGLTSSIEFNGKTYAVVRNENRAFVTMWDSKSGPQNRVGTDSHEISTQGKTLMYITFDWAQFGVSCKLLSE